MSLLNDAIKAEIIPKEESVTLEQMELGIAWAEGSVSTGAIARVLDIKPTSAFPLIARFLKAAMREGYLKRAKKFPEGAPNVPTTT